MTTPAPTEPLAAYLTRRAAEVNVALESSVPSADVLPTRLHEAMRYSLLAGGKRIRPVLVLAAGEALGASTDVLMPVACALEMIHTYSLIHDDLPAMDNDDLRRGRPTCHKVYGDALAILAGDALLTHAFLTLARRVSPERAAAVIAEIGDAAGAGEGMIGGQVIDLESEGKPVTAEELDRIHLRKTAALLRAAAVSGGLVAGASDAQLEALRLFGIRIGLAFQVADDVLDVTGTSSDLGKTPGKDVAANKATYPSLFGVQQSIARSRALVDAAIDAIAILGPGADRLRELARFVVARTC